MGLMKGIDVDKDRGLFGDMEIAGVNVTSLL